MSDVERAQALKNEPMFVCESCGFKGRAYSFLSCPVVRCKSHEKYEGQKYGYAMPYPDKTTAALQPPVDAERQEALDMMPVDEWHPRMKTDKVFRAGAIMKWFDDYKKTIKSALSVPAWRPIETHPKHMAEGRKSFLGGADKWVGEVYWNLDAQQYYLEGTHPTDFVDGSIDFLTHWQPLPPAPSSEGGT